MTKEEILVLEQAITSCPDVTVKDVVYMVLQRQVELDQEGWE